MTSLHGGPGWITAAAAAAVAAPLAGAAVVATRRPGSSPRVAAVAAAGTAVAAGIVAAALWHAGGGNPLGFGPALGDGRLVSIDGLGLVLVPYAAFLAMAVLLVAPRRVLDARAACGTLAGLAATLALFLTSHPVALVGLWIATARPTWRSTRSAPGGRPAARVFAIYMAAALACIAAGTALLVADPPWERSSGWLGIAGGWLVAVAVMIRKGIVPFHSWYLALFDGAPLSTALSATMPQVASYTAVRLLVGHAAGVPHELELLAVCALVTAVYGAALALVQRTLRGFIGAFSMSQSALVLAGLSGTLPLELTGAFCVWISSGLAITGIGLVSWALESRAGEISLERLQGRFGDAPALAAFFLLFGMASIGLPGTLSFVAGDLIVAGSLDAHLAAGLMVIVSTVLGGIAVMRCWFRVFGGPREADAATHAVLSRERVALTVLLATLFGLGIWPGPLVRALDSAAARVLGASPGPSRPAQDARPPSPVP